MSMPSRTVRAAVGLTAASTLALFVNASPSVALVGGKDTTIAKQPSVVQIFPGNTDWSPELCAGTMVTATKLVTSTFCVGGPDNPPSKIKVVAGRKNLKGKDGVTRTVSKVWLSPSLHWSSDEPSGVAIDDLAVLTLSKPMPKAYTPAKFVSPSDTYKVNSPVHTYGWGSSGGKEYVGRFQTATPDILPNSTCTKVYKKDFVAKEMLCVGKKKGGVDFCDGDTGSPLFITKGKKEILAGIASWGGQGCGKAGSPGVYVKLSALSAQLAKQLKS